MLLPRLAHTISRPRIALWLARHGTTPVRLLVGPMGSGKTSAVVAYLRQRGVPFAYCAIHPQFSIDELCADVASSLNCPVPEDYGGLKRCLERAGPMQLALENIDLASPPVREWITRLIEEAGENVGFIFTSRSWNVIDARRLASHGLAAILDDRALAFDAAEITALAEALGVPCTPDEAAQLCEETEGWPIVAAGAIREAFEHGRSLERAYDHWRKGQTYIFRRYLESCIEQVDTAVLEAWDHFVADGKLHSQSGAEQLRLAGLPVSRDAHGTHFPYRVVEQLLSAHLAVASVGTQKSVPLVVRVLGEFDATIAGESVKWIRRRDQQIFFYLLLKEGGSASRLELCEQFWPDVEPELRSASLRVACSNIRRAISTLCGTARVDNYFRSDGDIAVNFEHVTLDARRFRLHVTEGDDNYARGSHQEALAHYRMAESLYGGRIGWCSNADVWVNAQADLYESLYQGLLERLVALHRRADDAQRVHAFTSAASVKLTKRQTAKTPAAC